MATLPPPPVPGTARRTGAIYPFGATCWATGDPAPPGLTAAPSTVNPGPDAEPKQLRILIIEDNRDYADGLQTVFEILGHHALVTYNGTEGLEAAMRELPDAIVCDIGLPGVDGYEIARTLRANPVTASLFLVAVTGYASDADRELARKSGFNVHLAKPAEASSILEVIQANRKDGA